MAKVVLNNYDELLVSEKEVDRIKQDQSKADDLTRRMPYTITHEHGLWCGSLSDIKHFNGETKVNPHVIKDEDFERFHIQYGYGRFTEYYDPDYGVVDVLTQYMILTAQAKFVDNGFYKSLVMLPTNDKTDKWKGLWEFYTKHLPQWTQQLTTKSIS